MLMPQRLWGRARANGPGDQNTTPSHARLFGHSLYNCNARTLQNATLLVSITAFSEQTAKSRFSLLFFPLNTSFKCQPVPTWLTYLQD